MAEEMKDLCVLVVTCEPPMSSAVKIVLDSVREDISNSNTVVQGSGEISSGVLDTGLMSQDQER